MSNYKLLPALATLLLAAACSKPNAPEDSVSQTDDAPNPFLAASSLPYGMPAFDLIRDEHYLPAFERGMAEQMSEVEAIASNAEPATFENTIVAMERSGGMLDRTQRVFSAMTSAHTNDRIKAIETEMAPRSSAHNDNIRLNADLYARVASLYMQRDSLELDAESSATAAALPHRLRTCRSAALRWSESPPQGN